jgi:competence protein ComEC
VLEVSHHGSRDEDLARLLARLRPRLAVISVGARNHYGHPAPETLATLAAAGVPVRRTDLEGDISLECGAAG